MNDFVRLTKYEVCNGREFVEDVSLRCRFIFFYLFFAVLFLNLFCFAFCFSLLTTKEILLDKRKGRRGSDIVGPQFSVRLGIFQICF